MLQVAPARNVLVAIGGSLVSSDRYCNGEIVCGYVLSTVDRVAWTGIGYCDGRVHYCVDCGHEIVARVAVGRWCSKDTDGDAKQTKRHKTMRFDYLS